MESFLILPSKYYLLINNYQGLRKEIIYDVS